MQESLRLGHKHVLARSLRENPGKKTRRVSRGSGNSKPRPVDDGRFIRQSLKPRRSPGGFCTDKMHLSFEAHPSNRLIEFCNGFPSARKQIYQASNACIFKCKLLWARKCCKNIGPPVLYKFHFYRA